MATGEPYPNGRGCHFGGGRAKEAFAGAGNGNTGTREHLCAFLPLGLWALDPPKKLGKTMLASGHFPPIRLVVLSTVSARLMLPFLSSHPMLPIIGKSNLNASITILPLHHPYRPPCQATTTHPEYPLPGLWRSPLGWGFALRPAFVIGCEFRLSARMDFCQSFRANPAGRLVPRSSFKASPGSLISAFCFV